MRSSGSEYLVDSNVLLYLVHVQSDFHESARRCVELLEHEGFGLCYTPQNAAEFWAICTRPVAQGGLGFTVDDTLAQLEAIRDRFRLLAETPELFGEWQEIARMAGSMGRHVHDARLAASMRLNGVGKIVTKNVRDFRRFPSLDVLDLEDVLAGRR